MSDTENTTPEVETATSFDFNQVFEAVTAADTWRDEQRAKVDEAYNARYNELQEGRVDYAKVERTLSRVRKAALAKIESEYLARTSGVPRDNGYGYDD